MTERLLHVMIGLSIALILWILISIRRAHIRVEYSVSWLLAASAVLLLSLWRESLDWLARIIGFPDAPLALMFIVLCAFLVVFFRFSAIISDLKDANIALTQRVAILEFRLESASEERQTSSGS